MAVAARLAAAPRSPSSFYFASLAVALCEGPITGIGHLWAEDKPMNLDGVTMRVHLSGEDRPPMSSSRRRWAPRTRRPTAARPAPPRAAHRRCCAGCAATRDQVAGRRGLRRRSADRRAPPPSSRPRTAAGRLPSARCGSAGSTHAAADFSDPARALWTLGRRSALPPGSTAQPQQRPGT